MGVPILLATFDNQVPIDVKSNIPVKVQKIEWQWRNDSGWVKYGTGQEFEDTSQIVIEGRFQSFIKGKTNSLFTMSFTRLNDKKTQNYIVDLKKDSLFQKNELTNYTRKIRRLVDGK